MSSSAKLSPRKGVSEVLSDADLSSFVKDRYDARVGARGLPGYIVSELEPQIVNKLLEGNQQGTFQVTYDLPRRAFQVNFEENSLAA